MKRIHWLLLGFAASVGIAAVAPSGGGGSSGVPTLNGTATNLQVYSTGTTNSSLRAYGTNATDAVYVGVDAELVIPTTIKSAGSFMLQSGGAVFYRGNAFGAWYEQLNSQGLLLPNGAYMGFGSVFGAFNSAFYRVSDGLIEVNNGTAGSYRDLRLRTLQMYAQPSDPASSATLGMIYAKTNAGTTEVFVMDGAGNVTQISPHARAGSPAPPELDTDAQPIVIHHANLFLGTEEFLHLSALAKEVEKLSGKKFLFQRPLDPARKRDWNTEETAIEQRHAAERAVDLERLAAWQSNTNQNKGPQPPVRPVYQKRTKPSWLHD